MSQPRPERSRRLGLRVGLHLALVVWATCQLQCLERAERRCETQASCDGTARPSVCFQGKCVLKVCEPGKRQRCFEASCDAQGTPCPAAVRGVGGCADGYQLCLDNGSRWSACIGSNPPVEEICDGVDNDCDGKTDEDLDCSCTPGETRPCYTGHPDTLQEGNQQVPCAKGTQRCVGDPARWGPCEGQRRPQDLPQEAADKCLITDLDCDGKLDAFGVDCSCEKAGDTRDCFAGPQAALGAGGPCKAGTQTCSEVDGALRWGACVGQILPTPEENQDCNGKDDDCDGKVDNVSGQPFALFQPCGDAAMCQVQLCKDGAWQRCQKQELCNNQRDDNCDGMLDEQPCNE